MQVLRRWKVGARFELLLGPKNAIDGPVDNWGFGHTTHQMIVPRWMVVGGGLGLMMALVALAIVLFTAISGPQFVMQSGTLQDGCNGDAYYDHSICDVSAVFKNIGGSGTGVVTFTAATADFRGDPSTKVTETPGPTVRCRSVLPRTDHNDVVLAACRLVAPVYPYVYNATPYYNIKADTIKASATT